MPYALTVWHSSASGQRTEVKLLNIGSENGETQFDLDMMGVPEYDEVELHLADSARDFVARAHVAGLDNLAAPPRADLGTSVIFDFSHEGLGAGLTLKFPSSAFRYLRVNLPQIATDQILGAVAVEHSTNSLPSGLQFLPNCRSSRWAARPWSHGTPQSKCLWHA